MSSQFFRNIRVNSLGTLASRMFGMLRDMATASLLGLDAGGVMDAFTLSFRIPNLFRRLFGEGALTASYLPVLTAKLESDKDQAWQLISVLISLLAMLLIVLVLLGWLLCAGLSFVFASDENTQLVLQLTSMLLPYVIFICVAAQLAATLHSLNHFSAPAFAPVLLNICWLMAAWWIAPWMSDDKTIQVYVIAVSILIGGVLQVLIQLPFLYQLGFRFDFNWQATKQDVTRIFTSMGPTLLGLSVTQLNTFFDSLIAWGLANPNATPTNISWLSNVQYPLQQGAVAAIYFGERMYQFPLGLIGIAVSTAIFPLLSRHAARTDYKQLGIDLTLGLRLVMVVAIPASVGLILLSLPVTQLLFQHGEFTAENSQRTAIMISAYSSGVWAYCALPVLVRAYYATNNQQTPIRIGIVFVLLNVCLNLLLIWSMAESGLAIATAISASLQAICLGWFFSQQIAALQWRDLLIATIKTLVSSLVMGIAIWFTLSMFQASDSLTERAIRLFVPVFVGVTVYFSCSALLRQSEWWWLIQRENPSS